MNQSRGCEQRLRELIDADLPADDLERLVRVDALLREAVAGAASPELLQRPLAVPSRDAIAMPSHDPRTSEERVRPTLRLVTTPQVATESKRHRTDEQTHELKLTFGELALIYKSLQAVKTLGVLPPQDELLNDTIQLVDQALGRAI
jgi:hypothetical protein